MEAQACYGDILIALGGGEGEGVLFLANLYHDAGKPVIRKCAEWNLNNRFCARESYLRGRLEFMTAKKPWYFGGKREER
jgi:hypothetical protein